MLLFDAEATFSGSSCLVNPRVAMGTSFCCRVKNQGGKVSPFPSSGACVAEAGGHVTIFSVNMQMPLHPTWCQGGLQ
eukprot:1149058-Pelagomonas_calceolata.AAC.4